MTRVGVITFPGTLDDIDAARAASMSSRVPGKVMTPTRVMLRPPG